MISSALVALVLFEREFGLFSEAFAQDEAVLQEVIVVGARVDSTYWGGLGFY